MQFTKKISNVFQQPICFNDCILEFLDVSSSK